MFKGLSTLAFPMAMIESKQPGIEIRLAIFEASLFSLFSLLRISSSIYAVVSEISQALFAKT